MERRQRVGSKSLRNNCRAVSGSSSPDDDGISAGCEKACTRGGHPGLGREILGTVPDREESEDVHVGIDKFCEDLFMRHCLEIHGQHGVKFWIKSEHNPAGYGIGCEGPEEDAVEVKIDPFDGTDQYLKGIREAWWSVVGFQHCGTSFLGGAVDILGGVIYRAYNGEADRIFTRTNRREIISPSTETVLSHDSVVASYKGKWRYFFPLVALARRLFSKLRLAGVTHYGNGGSFIYALLRAGVVSVYIMAARPGEPNSEIAPGGEFVRGGDLCLLVVKGRKISRFNIEKAGMEGRVDGVFIAACNEALGRCVARSLARPLLIDWVTRVFENEYLRR